MKRSGESDTLAPGEQNASIRKETRCPLTLRAQVRSERDSFTAYLMNLSPNGAFVTTERRLHAGENVTITCNLPGQLGRVHLDGEVRWVQGKSSGLVGNESAGRHQTAEQATPPGAGVAFSELGEDTRARLTAYCRLFLSLAEQIDRAADGAKPK